MEIKKINGKALIYFGAQDFFPYLKMENYVKVNQLLK